MSVELRPLGVKCNIQCQYCYQNPQRDAGNVIHEYDLELMKQRILEEGGPFTMFGGEPLLVSEKDLEHLWAWGLDKFGTNGIQTNGVLINDEHIRMFVQYKVSVGISVDGPGELNDVRWQGSLKSTRESTAKTHAAIERLCRDGIPPSLIITLHRNNATADKLPAMHDWFRHLAGIGVKHARLHILEVDHDAIQKKYALTSEENLQAFLSFARLEKELPSLYLDVFRDMRNLLLGDDSKVTCIWSACDPYTTRAVRGVEGNGQSSNCGRTNKDGIDFTKAGQHGFERYLALYHTPQEYGGCKDCRFFLMCKGQCPGTAIDGDWRNRTEHCATWMTLFDHLEKEFLGQGVIPLSVSPKRRDVERLVNESWLRGQNLYVNQALLAVDDQASSHAPRQQAGQHGDSHHGDAHGDHTDAGRRDHGDHGDHGDHNDANR